MNTLEAFHMRCQRLMYAGRFMSPMQRCFSDLVCQPLVTSYVIDTYLCLAMLHAWNLMVDTYEGRKASWRRPPGRPLNVWLSKIQDTNALLLSTLWRSEIAMGHGAAQRSLGIRDDDDSDDDDDDDEDLCQKWRVKLIFRGTYRLSRTCIVECLKTIDV